ncbi:reverse transcriptase domain-containing protein, partial [Tanacetum coccineum]
TRGRSGDQGDGRDDGQGGQVGGQVSEVNDHVNGVPDFSTIIAQQLQNLLPTSVAQDFLACNPKEYDGKGGAIVYTRWIEKMESVHDMSGCRDSKRVKYSAGSFVGKALTWWNSKIRTRGREAAIVIESRAMVGAGHAAYTDRFHELARLVPHLVTPEGKKIERYVYGLAPQIQGMMVATESKTIQKAVQLAGTLTDEALRNGSIKKNPEKKGNVGEPSKDRNGREDNKKTKRLKMLLLQPQTLLEEVTWVRHPSVPPVAIIVHLRHLVAVDSTVTAHDILLGIIKWRLGIYEIEIASGQLVEIDKVIRGCKLEIEGHMFNINLIPFGSGSFDVIIGMDWLSDHKAEIIFHEKVVRIPLLDGKVLRVLGEKPEEKMRQLMSAKAKEKKQEEIVVVRYFLEVFLDDLSGLPLV